MNPSVIVRGVIANQTWAASFALVDCIVIVKDDRRFEICLQQIVRVKRKPLSLLCVIENPHDVHTILGIYNSC